MADAESTRPQWGGKECLDEAVSRWPTPTATDAKASGSAGYSTESGRHSGTTLTDAAVRGGQMKDRSSRPDPRISTSGPSTSTAGLRLNPLFDEVLMGLPMGWTGQTALEPAEMELYLSRQRSRLRILLGGR